MRRGLRATTILFLIAVSCGKGRRGAAAPTVPPGDALYFRDGIPSEQTEIEQILARGGFAHVFLPAVRLERNGNAWSAKEVAPPARSLSGVPVVLVVGGPGVGFDPSAGEAFTTSIEGALGRVLASRNAYGKVEGVHVQLAFPVAAAEALGSLLGRIRKAVPADLFVTCALEGAPPEKERDEFRKRLSPADGFVTFVFGEQARGDLVATDALGKPWWAGYAPSAVGEWKDAAGNPRGELFEGDLSALTDEPLTPLHQELSLSTEEPSAFLFRPTARVEIRGKTFEPGDQISFRQPAVSELLFRFGSDLTGRKLVRGRLIRLDGVSEGQRLFTLAALSDVLLGRPLVPDLRVRIVPGAAAIRVEAENLSDHASVISRTTNWVEVEVPPGEVRDAQLGGFDRYEVFDAEGRPVTPGRAARLRFFEILVGPRERIEPATIQLRGQPPPGCCRFRQHVLAASGSEVAGDWISPPPPPTPTPAPAKSKRRG